MENALSVKDLTNEGRILIIDDEWAIRDILQTILVAEGYLVDCAENGVAGLDLISHQPYDVVVTDLLMPGMSGEEVVTRCRRMRPETECIITTGMSASEAMQTANQIGAIDSLAKPFNFEHLKIVVRRVREIQKLRLENSELKSRLKGLSQGRELIGHSDAVASLRHVLRTVAESDASVLITGESGSGRERAAHEIHRASSRCSGPWVVVNCASMPEEVLDLEMFGTEPGATAGSPAGRTGWIESAHDGTIYLEDIDGLPLGIQHKLLHAIESRSIHRMGSERATSVNVRVIASTRRDLDEDLASGKFSRELYYRIHVIPVRVPSLRERREDIPLLLAHFAEERSQRDGRPPVRFSPAALSCLLEHDWQGNLREMMNFVERMALLHSGAEVDIRDLPDAYRAARMRIAARTMFEQTEGSVDFNHLVDEYERALIDLALRKARGVKHHAATLLKLKRTTLVEKMKKKRINPNPYADLSQSGA